jgi:superfamily II DNA or RNA helicase
MRGIARVVTGAGKTMFAEMAMLEFLGKQPDGRIVVITPTIALLDQWFVDLREDIGLGDSDVAVFSGEQRADAPARVNLLVLNTARTEAEALSVGVPTMLVVDECHRAAAPVNSLALHGQHVAALGLSATPERQYDDGLRDVLVPALGQIIFDYGYDQARHDGVITAFELVNVAVELDEDEREAYEKLSRRVGMAMRAYKAGDDDGARLKVLLRQRAAISGGAQMRIPVAAAIADRHRGRRTVIFHEKIDAAEQIHRLLSKRDHNVTLYHSKIAPAVRRDNLRLFRRGVFQALVSCRALDEGINVPEAEIGIIASSTASHRQRVQRLGRVLRPAPGKDVATVYTLFATEIEERRLQEEAENLSSAEGVRWQRASSGG